MNLWLRLLRVLAFAWAAKRIGFLGRSRLFFRTMPHDLDVYLHMNNGRYLTLMDLGRMDWIIRTGLYGHAQRNGWKPLVGAVKAEYKKSLQLFEGVILETRILAWDEKWFYIEQTFKRGSGICARAVVRGLFRGPSGNVPTEEVLKVFPGEKPMPQPLNGLQVDLPDYQP